LPIWATALPTARFTCRCRQDQSEETSLNTNITNENLQISTEQTNLTTELNEANYELQEIPSQLDEINEIYSSITGYNQIPSRS
jgi:flagellar hook-associated protein 2